MHANDSNKFRGSNTKVEIQIQNASLDIKAGHSKLNILIVGASIAGLSAATALMQSGHVTVNVFERSSMGAEVERQPRNGGGIGLHRKSADILKKMGVPTNFKLPMGNQEDRDRNGRIIRRIEIPFYSAHWGDVHKGLTKSALESGAVIHYSKDLVNLTETQDGATLTFSDETCATGDCVVGADGVLSPVRSFMFRESEDLVRYAGYYIWRGLVQLQDLSDDLKARVYSAIPKETLSFEISEKSHVVFYYLNRGLNWVVYLNSDPEATPIYRHRNEAIGCITKEATVQELNKFYETIEKLYRPILVEIIRAGGTKAPFINYIYDRDPISTYSTARCLLIGDAAHSPTPHHIRGSNMAIQDGYALAKSLLAVGAGSDFVSAEHYNMKDMFLHFENERLEYCNNVVLTARRIGRVKQGVYSLQKQGHCWNTSCTMAEFSDMLMDGNN